MQKNDIHSLSHTKWNCKYHIVFAPKYRRKVFFGQMRYEIGKIIRESSRWKGVNLLEAEACPDHIHILASLPKNMCVSEFVKTIKVNSSKWMKTINHYYTRFAWQLGFGAFSVSPSILDNTIRYIKNQAEHHRVKTFQEEYKMILDAYGIEYDERYIFAD